MRVYHSAPSHLQTLKIEPLDLQNGVWGVRFVLGGLGEQSFAELTWKYNLFRSNVWSELN